MHEAPFCAAFFRELRRRASAAVGMRASYDAWGAHSVDPQHAGHEREKEGGAITGLYQVFAFLQFCGGADRTEERMRSSCETLESFLYEVTEDSQEPDCAGV